MDSVDGGPHQSSALVIIVGNDDLVTEILLLLPVRSLLRFKSVSKHWLSLITDPDFCNNHGRLHSNSLPGLLLRNYPRCTIPEFEYISLNAKPAKTPFRSLPFDRFQILESCNGLLCCCIGDYRRNYFIYNPATNLYTTLFLPTNRYTTLSLPACGTDSIVLGVSLAFDPSESPHYKAVCVLITDQPKFSCQIEIYSSETRQWRPSGKSFTAPNDIAISPGVFWNGALHWIGSVCTWRSSLCFDVEQECFRKLPMLPIPRGQRKHHIYFGESPGHMYYIEVYTAPATHFEILEMERDYSKWFVKYRVDLDPVTVAYPEMVRSHLSELD